MVDIYIGTYGTGVRILYRHRRNQKFGRGRSTSERPGTFLYNGVLSFVHLKIFVARSADLSLVILRSSCLTKVTLRLPWSLATRLISNYYRWSPRFDVYTVHHLEQLRNILLGHTDAQLARRKARTTLLGTPIGLLSIMPTFLLGALFSWCCRSDRLPTKAAVLGTRNRSDMLQPVSSGRHFLSRDWRSSLLSAIGPRLLSCIG